MIRPLVTAVALALVASDIAAQNRWRADYEPQLQYVETGRVPDGVTLCRSTIPPLTPDSIGPLRLGVPLREILRACPDPTFGWDWGDEGTPTPALAVAFGEAFVLVTLVDTTLSGVPWSFSVGSPGFRTDRGVGPGSRLAELEAVYGSVRLFAAECAIYAVPVGEQRLSWRLTLPGDQDCAAIHTRADGGTDTSWLPDDTTVLRVILVRGDA